MTKIIHYCWFGGKPLPKLAKECIKSWEKYLPDFKIIRWDESNCDVTECKFVEEAYQNKKWAFVADYFRAKVLNEMGGLYFDTDMKIIKPIDDLLKEDAFLGIEDSGNVAVGVWWEKHPHSYLSSKLLEYYQNAKKFDINNMYNFSIPILVSKYLQEIGYDEYKKGIQRLNKMTIYPREYFYPLSYDRQDNIFTDNTCMIHYYDATWTPKWEQKQIKYIRIFGREKANKIINFISNAKGLIKKIIKVILYPYVIYRKNKNEQIQIKSRREEFIKKLDEVKSRKEIAIYNSSWLGTGFATKELFANTLSLPELYEKDDFNFYAKKILEKEPTIIIFSAFAKGWDELIKVLKNENPNIKIKVIWHGSNAVHMLDYDFSMFSKIFELLETKMINSIGFVKKSMYELYKEKGYNVEFIENTVRLDYKPQNKKVISNNIKIGIYASGDRWVKNFYNQLAAASQIKNAIIDVIPLQNRTKEFAKILKCKIIGESTSITREELLERMSKNDINLYTTFVDCAPLTPIESLELGVPCITGNNHHYWDNTKLYDYLVVDKVDNTTEIKNKIEYSLRNKDKILKLYKEWKNEQDKKSKNSVDQFIKRT